MVSEFWNEKNVLVTGGASFIGSHLVDKLVSLGASVTIADDLSTGKMDNLKKSQDKIFCVAFCCKNRNLIYCKIFFKKEIVKKSCTRFARGCGLPPCTGFMGGPVQYSPNGQSSF